MLRLITAGGRPLALTVALLLPIAAGAVLSGLRGVITNNNAALVLVLVVVAVAATGHRVAGLLAAVVSAVSFDFFLTQPYLQLAIAERDDVEAAVLLALIGLAVTELALWGRRQQARASRHEGYLRGVMTAARLATTGLTTPSDVVALVTRQLVEVLDLDDARFDPGPPTDTDRPRLQSDGRITWRGHVVDVEREGLPTLDALELPVASGGVERGRFLLVSTSAVRRPELQRRQVAVALAEQAAVALGSAQSA